MYKKIWYTAGLTTLLLSTGAAAAVKKAFIEVPEREYHAGTIAEGAQRYIRHTFIVTNTGNADLVIERVRVSCGCTIVKHDSVIKPGKTALIEPEVDITGFTGAVEKGVTIISNAINEPALRLALKVHIKPIIGVSKRFIRIIAGDTVPTVIQLSTEKPDLAITGLECRPLNVKGKKQWQTFSQSLRYTLNKTETADNDSLYTYDFSLSSGVTITQTAQAEILLRTNHPEKKELRIRAIIHKQENE